MCIILHGFATKLSSWHTCISGLVVEYIVAIDVTRVDSRLTHFRMRLQNTVDTCGNLTIDGFEAGTLG